MGTVRTDAPGGGVDVTTVVSRGTISQPVGIAHPPTTRRDSGNPATDTAYTVVGGGIEKQ